MSVYTGTMTPQEMWEAIERSGMDLTLCANCYKPVVTIPDGLACWCESCADKAAK